MIITFFNLILKFVELQDYNVSMYIVADENRRGLFASKLSQDAFTPIRGRVKFWSYDHVSALHSKSFELAMLGSGL